MNAAFTAAPVTTGTRLKTLRTVAAAVLVVGGGTGLLLNRTTADNRRLLQDQERLLMQSEPLRALPPTEPVVAPETAGGRRVLFALRPVDVTPPPNPFEATPMPMAPAMAPTRPGGGGALGRSPGPLPPADGIAVMAAPAPGGQAAAPVRPAAPTPADMELTGVVQGDPPLAVVQFQGQSLFLKIGDQVADSWRLVEIKERSAIFQMGARRVEIPIKGGSSE